MSAAGAASAWRPEGTSSGTSRFPFAIPLEHLAHGGGSRGAAVSPDDISANRTVMTTEVMLDVFTPEECRRIVAIGEAQPLRFGGMVGRDDYRKATNGWLPPDAQARWIYERLAKMVADVNAWYRYRLFGFLEPLHFIRYEPGGKFDWHLDVGPDTNCTRKLSVTVQLTDPGAYEGGGLEFCPHGELHRSRYQGACVVFPSVLAHRVTPVTRGVRHSLVAWIHGPSFQ